jgi:hypothetical protein
LDSNQRRHSQQIYSLPPLATRAPLHGISLCNDRWSHQADKWFNPDRPYVKRRGALGNPAGAGRAARYGGQRHLSQWEIRDIHPLEARATGRRPRRLFVRRLRGQSRYSHSTTAFSRGHCVDRCPAGAARGCGFRFTGRSHALAERCPRPTRLNVFDANRVALSPGDTAFMPVPAANDRQRELVG